MYCSRCGHKLNEGAKICDNCGMPFDPNDVLLCDETVLNRAQEAANAARKSTVLNAGLTSVEANEHNGGISKGRSARKRACKKPILILGIGGVFAAVVIILLIVFTTTNESNAVNGSNAVKNANSVFYLKDDEIVYNDFSLEGEFEITSCLTNGENLDKSALARVGAMSGVGEYFGNAIAISSGGNRIFFPDRIDIDTFCFRDNCFTLYYRSLDDRDREASKIDSDIMLYAINRDGSMVLYLKEDNGGLYIHDLTKKKKLDSGVLCFYCTDDLKKICYLNEDGRLYLWNGGEDTTKLASDVFDIVYVSDDLSTIYYIKKDALELAIWNYIDDDLAASDALITEPEMPDYPDKPVKPSGWHYPTTEEYSAAKAQYDIDYEFYKETCDRLQDEYSNAYNAYQEKCEREILRENLRNSTLEYNEFILYCYDGYKAELLAENVVLFPEVHESTAKVHESTAVMVVSIYNPSEIPIVKLSEISSLDEASELILNCLRRTIKRRLVVGMKMPALQGFDLYQVEISSEGNMVAFLSDPSSNNSIDGYDADIYTVLIKDGQVGPPERFDDEVDVIDSFDANHIIYYKNIRDWPGDWAGDLYINGDVIDYDVSVGSTVLANDYVVYYVNLDSEQEKRTLRLYKNGEKTTIANDVHDFVITDNGDILYLCDYSSEYYTGVLYRYRNGQSEKVADDVIGIIKLGDTPYQATY